MANLLQILGLAAGPAAAFGTGAQGIPRPIQSIDPNTGLPVSGPIINGMIPPTAPQPEIPASSGVPTNLLEGTPYDQSNVLQAIGGSPDAPQPASVPQAPQPATPAEAPRSRRSLLDTVGRISDVLARVGGAEALYQPTLDAREDRALAMEDRQRGIDMDALRQQLAQQQVDMGAQAPQEMMRARLGQALGAVARSENPAVVWSQIDPALLGIDAQTWQAIGQRIETNPQSADILARMFGYEEPRQGSQSAGIQNYGMYQRILAEQGPEAAEQFLRVASPQNFGMSPNQQAQTEIAKQRLTLDIQRAAAASDAARRRLQLLEQKQEGGAGSDLTPTQRGVVLQKLKTLPVVRQQLNRVRTLQNEMVQGGTLARGAVGGLLPGAVAGGKAEQFDKALGALRKSILSLTRTPGVGSMSNYETALDEMALPSRWGSDAGRVEALQGIEELVNGLESGYKEMVPAGRTSQPNRAGGPPSAAISYLRQNPNLAAQFDAKYGRGAAARVLGGR